MLLAVGLVSALLESQKSGRGQVVDAAMSDGSALLMSLFYSLQAQGQWRTERGSNLLDSGAPFYDVYETKDGKYISIGPLEPQLYAVLLEKLGIGQEEARSQYDPGSWPEWSERFSKLFKTRSRDEWCERLEGTEACFTPVLDFNEAVSHPHNRARKTHIEVGGMVQPAPAPRFSRTQPEVAFAAHEPGSDFEAVMQEWGIGKVRE